MEEEKENTVLPFAFCRSAVQLPLRLAGFTWFRFPHPRRAKKRPRANTTGNRLGRMEDCSLAKMPKRDQRMHSAGRSCGKHRNVKPNTYNESFFKRSFDSRLLLHAMLFVLRPQDSVHGVGSAVGRLMEVAHLHFT